MDAWLENFWAEILSREPARIQAAMATLEDDEQREAIIVHLRRMTTEEGWLEPQRISAQVALEALGITY
jgi:NADH:ubiquinone oxidoreductase subunit E